MKLTEEFFTFKYNPISNEDDDWQIDTDTDLSLIDNKKIWTVIDCDGALVLTAGKHFVNRMYYVVTEISRTEDWEENIEVCLEDLLNRYEIISIVKKILNNEFNIEETDEVDDILHNYF